VDDDRSLPPWAIAGGIVAALALIFVLGVGFGSAWGAEQWGPLAAWLAGAATFGAVIVALRVSSCGRSARRHQRRGRRAGLRPYQHHRKPRRAGYGAHGSSAREVSRSACVRRHH